MVVGDTAETLAAVKVAAAALGRIGNDAATKSGADQFVEDGHALRGSGLAGVAVTTTQ